MTGGTHSRNLGIFAGMVNFSILAVNAGFSRADELAELNPGVFSSFSQIIIVIWGLSFIAAGLTNARGTVWASFAVEKAAFVGAWLMWLKNEPELVAQAKATAAAAFDSGDLPTLQIAVFHLAFGLVDGVFGILFFLNALAEWQSERDARTASNKRKH